MAAPRVEKLPAGAEKARAKGNASMKEELSVPKDASGNVISAQTFTFRQLAAATRNFRPECFIGEGGFGRVYKGRLDGTGQVVAIKQLNRDGNQGNREFLTEVLMLSLLHHQNLVNLVGYCADGDQRLLVYEYMPLGSLEGHLHYLPPDKEPLDWNTRMKIAAGAAKGLEYLHDKAQPPVIHRDVKSANILLGKDFHPKLSDFGHAKLGPVVDESNISTRVETYGYCAPEYAMTGQLTVKSDVYSFGVVLLELITGRKAIDSTKPHGEQDLVSWARPLFNDRRMLPKMADPGLEGRYPMHGLYEVLAVAAMCTQSEAASRPLIADVVTALSYLASQSYEPNATHGQKKAGGDQRSGRALSKYDEAGSSATSLHTGKGMAQEQEQPSLENQYENVEADSNRQHGILEMNTGKGTNNQADCRISMSPESSSHLPSPDGHATIDIEETYETKLPSTATLADSQNVMPEIVIFLAIKKIGIALGNEATQQVGAQFAKFVTQLTELQGTMGRVMTELRVMHDFLCQMDIRNRNNQVYEGWLEEVRKVAYVIEDMVDEYLHLVGRERDVGWSSFLKKGFKQPKALLSLYRIASMVKEIEANLIHQSQMKERWVPTINNGDTTNSSYIVQRSHDLASISRSLGEDLVGIGDNKQTLVQWLGDDKLVRSVIVLHGMGGLGKTALAATVYKEEREKFDCHAWVSISQTYSREDVLRRLIVELFRDKQSVPSNIATMDMTAMQETLKMFLEQKRYLVTLDDVWTPEAWNDLFGALPSNLKGSRIIITTRIADVAHLAFPDQRILTLEPLSKDESWELFCKKAFPDHECPAELETLSMQIVGRCEGLPLAIVSIGSLLFVRDKTVDEWKRIHDQLSWEINNNPRLDHIRNVLLLSFIYLPTYLKFCFLYCSLFPEDYLFKRKKLVRLWIVEGFIEKRGQSTIEEVAEGYLNELVHRNMLQLIERNHFGRIKSFRMHDIVRELAVDLCRRECFGVAYEEDKYGGESFEKDGRRLVIHKLKKGHIPESISSAHHLRSVIALDSSMPSSTLLPLMVEKCRYMSVLELSGLPIEKVPDAIGDLFNLRHFGLRGSKVKLLPKSIEKLSNLLTLDLCRSNIQELPRGITKLKKLRHLFAEKWIDLSAKSFRWGAGVCIPKGLKNLTDLQTLQGLEAEYESVRHLGELRQLRSFRIWNVKRIYCEGLCESLVQMQFLSCLCIAASDENEVLQLSGLNPPPLSLQKIELRGRLAERTLEECPLFQTAGQNLYSLSLSWSQLREDPLPCLSRLSSLTQLQLTRAYNGEQLAFLTGWFPKLKILYLGDQPNLKRLEIQQGAMASLEKLELVNLRSLTEVPAGIEFLVPLKYLGFREISPEFLTLLHGSRIGDMPLWYTLRD